MKTLAITTPAELRQADHKAVIAWERYMRETERAAASTIRRRLPALSSLHKHLVRHDHAARDPVGEVERGDQSRRRLDPRLRESAGAQDARRAGGVHDRRIV
jgi:site-specific recombinase XerD